MPGVSAEVRGLRPSPTRGPPGETRLSAPCTLITRPTHPSGTLRSPPTQPEQAQPLLRRAQAPLLPNGVSTPTGVCTHLLAAPSPWDRVWERGLGLGVLRSSPSSATQTPIFSCTNSSSPLCPLRGQTPVPGHRAPCGAGPRGDCGGRNVGRGMCLRHQPPFLSLFLVGFALLVPTRAHAAPAQSRLPGTPSPKMPTGGLGLGQLWAPLQGSESAGETGAVTGATRRAAGRERAPGS